MSVTLKIDYLPINDGKDHINVYSKGQTDLGRLLSNFARTPFICEDGKFQSIEGYWYWLSISDDEARSVLRNLYGLEAKNVGRALKLRQSPVINPNFKIKICKAIKIKLESNGIDKMLKNSHLPLVHYYLFGKNKVISGNEWLMIFFERLRVKYQQHTINNS